MKHSSFFLVLAVLTGPAHAQRDTFELAAAAGALYNAPPEGTRLRV